MAKKSTGAGYFCKCFSHKGILKMSYVPVVPQIGAGPPLYRKLMT